MQTPFSVEGGWFQIMHHQSCVCKCEAWKLYDGVPARFSNVIRNTFPRVTLRRSNGKWITNEVCSSAICVRKLLCSDGYSRRKLQLYIHSNVIWDTEHTILARHACICLFRTQYEISFSVNYFSNIYTYRHTHARTSHTHVHNFLLKIGNCHLPPAWWDTIFLVYGVLYILGCVCEWI